MRLRAPLLVHIARSLLRFWGVGLLNVAGLSIGFAAAIIIALYVKNELEFDHFIPDADRVMLLSTVYSPLNSAVVSNDKSPAGMAGWLRTDAPAVEATTRLHPVEWSVRSPRFQSLEYFYWADSNLFDLLRVKAIAGDLKTALQKPYTTVLTRKMALRYFGRDDVIGQTLFINGNSPVIVTAVLTDFPANSSLNREFFVSAASDYSMLFVLDANPDWQWSSSYTFVRLKPGAHLAPEDVRRIAARHWHNNFNLPVKFRLTPLTDLHFQPEADSQMSPRGHLDTVTAMVAVAGLILFLAAVNFAGLMTAQIDERNSEMAIRRSLGARRHHLFLQVLFEAIAMTILAALAGLTLVERLLPAINPLLGLRLSLWASPGFVACCAAGAVLAGTAGGLYPALVLSSVPASQVRGGGEPSGRSYLSRVGWITVQFSLLIMLLVSSQIVYRQWAFASGAALNFDAARVLQIEVFSQGGLDENFRRQILALDGVQDAAFSRFIPEERDIRPAWSSSPTGQRVQFNRQSVDTNFFRMFGVRLLAGRNFSATYNANNSPTEIILSRSAAEALGYHRPSDAVGHVLDYEGDHARIRSKIIGVADDMRIDTVRESLQPIIFDNQAFFFTRLNVKLKPGKEAATLVAIDNLWKLTYPNANPINRHFYSKYLGELYHDMIQQWWAFGLLSVVGVVLSVLGLTGLSIYLARTRSREIAIRNALGARRWDLFRLQLEPFVKPLILANLAAGLMSWLLMSWWLNSFKAHVDINPTSFLSAGAVTVLVALITLTAHNFLTSPARSSQSLRTN